MKLVKRMAATTLLSVMTATSSVTVFAADNNQPIVHEQNAPNILNNKVIGKEGAYKAYFEVKDESKIAVVRFNGLELQPTATWNEKNGYEASITKSGNYDIYVQDEYGNNKTYSYYFEVPKPVVKDTEAPKIVKTWVEVIDKKSYAMIQVEDATGVSEVQIGGEWAGLHSGDSKKGVYKVEISKSQKLNIYLEDKNGNYDYKDVQFNLKADKTPTLALTQTEKNGKTYITIKFTAPKTIKEITVKPEGKDKEYLNIDKVRNNNGTLEYEVKDSGKYTVEVVDEDNNKKSQDINVNVKTNAPTLDVYKEINNGRVYLNITVKDTTTLDRLTVNDVKIAMDKNGGSVKYEINKNGDYTVIAKTTAGKEVKQTITVGEVNNNNNNNNNNNYNGKTNTVKFQLNSKDWTINGENQAKMDAAPILRGGRTYIPIRYTSYALGIPSEFITWNGRQKLVTIQNGADTVKITVNSTTLVVNNKSMIMDGAAFELGGRVYIPISQVSKAFPEVSMDWNNTTKIVTIEVPDRN